MPAFITGNCTLTGGSINNVAIGGSTPAAVTTNSLTATGGTIDGVAIGGSTPAAVSCTTLTCSSTIDMGAGSITNVGAPTAANHAATKSYVDNFVQGLVIRESVVVATAAALTASTYDNGTDGVGATITCDSNEALTVDGVTMAVNDRVLVKDEGTAAYNGIYTVTVAGDGSTAWVLTRATDVDTAAEVQRGIYVHALGEGTANGDSAWVLTDAADVGTIGTDAQNFSAFGGSVTLTSTGSTIDISTYDIDVDESHAFSWTGAHTFTSGSSTYDSGSFISLASSAQLRFGDSNEVTQSFASNDFTLENTDTSGSIIAKTGTATNATEFKVVDSADASLMEVKGNGALVFSSHTETSSTTGWGGSTATSGHRIIRMDGASLTGNATVGSSEHLVLYAGSEGQVLTVVYVADGAGPSVYTADLLIPGYIGPGGGAPTDTTITFDNQGQGITLVGIAGGFWMSMHGGHS